MELKGRKPDNNCLIVDFSIGETDVLRAVAREKVARLARESKTEQISRIDLSIASFREGGAITLTTPNIARTVGDLASFADTTEESVAEYASRRTALPDYANQHVAQRIILGNQARAMGSQLTSLVSGLEMSELEASFQLDFAGGEASDSTA
jgi:hypothetical protein